MKFLKYLSFLMLLILASCRSSQSTTEGPIGGNERSEQVFIGKVVANGQKSSCVTARIAMDLDALGKQLSVNGKLRMKRDMVIQLSLSLLGFEVGRLEFTPQHVLLIDRVNRQYVKADYRDVSFLQQAGLDFYSLQSLFWNELFIPGQQEIGEGWQRFVLTEEGNHILLSLNDAPHLKYLFQVQQHPTVLNRVSVQGKRNNDLGKFEWGYDRFVRLDNRYFPSFMECKVTGLSKPIGFTLSLSSLDNDDHWENQTKLSSRYKQRTVEEVLGLLMGM